jgi:hypothetical protein
MIVFFSQVKLSRELLAEWFEALILSRVSLLKLNRMILKIAIELGSESGPLAHLCRPGRQPELDLAALDHQRSGRGAR